MVGLPPRSRRTVHEAHLAGIVQQLGIDALPDYDTDPDLAYANE